MSPRLQHWPSLLAAYVESRRATPFAWGAQDCCQFARGALEAMTGRDPALEWKLRPYRTARTAAAQLRRLGGLEALPVRAGLAPVPVLLAGRGAVVLIPNGGLPALGVVIGAKATFAGEQGLEFVPLGACALAWEAR